MSTLPQVPEIPRLKLDVTSLEADVAYFDARLSFVGSRPETVYQRAQIRTYEALARILGDTLSALKGRRR